MSLMDSFIPIRMSESGVWALTSRGWVPTRSLPHEDVPWAPQPYDPRTVHAWCDRLTQRIEAFLETIHRPRS